jgi:dynein light chain LC8-type
MNKKQQSELEKVPEPEIQFVDMKDELKQLALTSAKLAFLAKKKGEIQHWKDCAQMIKRDFDSNPVSGGPTWHCVVGTHFGSYFSHQSGSLIYFNVGHMVLHTNNHKI